MVGKSRFGEIEIITQYRAYVKIVCNQTAHAHIKKLGHSLCL